jgi:hypothetical protein
VANFNVLSHREPGVIYFIAYISDVGMTDGLKLSDRDLIEVLTQNFVRGTEKTHENTSVVLPGVPDEIRTEDLTRLELSDLERRVRSCDIEETQEEIQSG